MIYLEVAKRHASIWLLFAVCWLVALTPFAFAQALSVDVLAAWNKTAARAEQVLDTAAASDDAFQTLRIEIAAQRAAALVLVEKGSIEVRSLQAQLDALGPAPQEGDVEAEAISAQRKELRDKLAAANAPLLAARQSQQRADVIIQEIDRLLRSRSTSELLSRGPTPLSPSTWVAAIVESGVYFGRIGAELKAALTSPTEYVATQAPVAIALALAGLGILVLVLPITQSRLEAFLKRDPKRAASPFSGFASATTRLVLVLVGSSLIALAVLSLGMVSYSGRSLLLVVPAIPAILGLPYWIGHLVFAPRFAEQRLVTMNDHKARQGSRLSASLGWVLLAQLLLEVAENDFSFTPEAQSALAAVVVIAGCLLLYMLANTLSAASATGDGDSSHRLEDGHANILGLVAQLIKVIILVGIVGVLLGFVALSRQAMVPTIISLGLVGFGLALHRLLVAIPNALWGNRNEEEALSSLLPFVVGLILILLSAPSFAIVWGARPSDIVEIWLIASQGVLIGGNRISINAVMALVVVFTIGLFVTRWVQGIFRSSILPRTRVDAGGKSAITTGIGYVGISLAALVASAAAGLDLSNLAIVAGALSVGIGFGLQAIVSNFLSGIILLVERPVKLGDWIEVSGHSGIVRKIAVRATRIETFDRHDVIVPNSDLITGAVKNMTLSSKIGRVTLPVGVAYDSDVEQVRAILVDAAQNHERVLSTPEPMVLFMNLGDSSLDFELRCFVRDVNFALLVRSDLLFTIFAALGEANIEIPFPQRDISVRNAADFAKVLETKTTAQKPTRAAPTKPKPKPRSKST